VSVTLRLPPISILSPYTTLFRSQFTRPLRSSKSRMPSPQPLSAEQLLLTTLVVKLAVMAALATTLVRYRRFRSILIFEQRDWRRSEEHTSELQSRVDLVCRLLLE